MVKEYSSDVLALRERIRLGNKKLNDAWTQICKIDHESQQWRDELERWYQASEKLSALCTQLKALGYEDCLYLDEKGKKTMRCGGMGELGCRVCPSMTPYWEKELMELGGKQ